MKQKKLFLRHWAALLLAAMTLPVWQLQARSGPEKNFLLPAATVLRRADSLFAAGQYAAAAADYHQLVWRQRLASPQVLLRLAYARQQQSHTAGALLYLNLAQARQPRLRTWQQMADLAAEHQLVGYPSTWQQQLRVQFQRYYHSGLQALLAGAVMGAVWLLLRRRRRSVWLGYVAYLLLAATYTNALAPATIGLVARPGAVLMAGPGAGAAWLNTAAVGDRLVVQGRQDIWYRVQWQRRTAFIRQADLLLVQ